MLRGPWRGLCADGGPVGERNLYVLDPELNLVPPGTQASYIGGLGLARGYLSRRH